VKADAVVGGLTSCRPRRPKIAELSFSVKGSRKNRGKLGTPGAGKLSKEATGYTFVFASRLPRRGIEMSRVKPRGGYDSKFESERANHSGVQGDPPALNRKKRNLSALVEIDAETAKFQEPDTGHGICRPRFAPTPARENAKAAQCKMLINQAVHPRQSLVIPQAQATR